ncbi:TIGR03564 family F420-dependent LLM class oxidoreductase [Mycobacterium sp. ZZG]
MRIGLMVGSDKERPRSDRLAGLLADGVAAEAAGFSSFWFPQVPGYLDAMTAMALLGASTTAIEIGTAVVPIQTRHPMILAQQALTTNAACGGRFTLGLGLSHDWIINGQLGLSYDRPVRRLRAALDVLQGAFGGPGRVDVDVDNDEYHVHSPVDVTDGAPPLLLAALGPTMLRIAGEQADGTILWMADERAIAEHVAPRIAAAAEAAGRPAPRIVAGVPVALCTNDQAADARAHASEVLGHAHFSPNYVALLEHGDAADVGDTMAAGDEAAVLARLRAYRDAGVTDLAARIVPLGDDTHRRRESSQRTAQFLSAALAEL